MGETPEPPQTSMVRGTELWGERGPSDRSRGLQSGDTVGPQQRSMGNKLLIPLSSLALISCQWPLVLNARKPFTSASWTQRRVEKSGEWIYKSKWNYLAPT